MYKVLSCHLNLGTISAKSLSLFKTGFSVISESKVLVCHAL